MFLVLFVLILGFVSADDQINKLPGLKFDIGFKHYSGYLKASDTHFLHYWFVESQGNPSHDPLVFWFNGGPGCSSLDGLLNEMGPYQINPDGKTLRKNENAWNQIASIVYIEAPAGVGYSYSTDGNITTDDDQTSTENYAAIRTFFDRYPRFRNHSVFVTGESYGGVYIPTLAGRIIDGQTQFPINLKGLAIGNGYMNAKLNIDTSVRFAYGHGILDQKTWDTIEKECCRGCIDGCDLTAVTGHCASMVEEVFNFLWAGGLNVYDLYRDCDPNPERNSIRLTSMLQGLGHKNVSSTGYFGSKWMGSLGQGLTSDAPCLNDSDAITYMNNVDVRTALNIPFNLDRWDICSDKVTSTYKKKYDDMTPFIKKALAENIRILLYYGDTDMACNFMLGQQFAASLGLKRMIGKQPWKYGKQIAGFKTIYKGLTFTTIRGAGHMAPQWRAPEMRYAFGQFLLNHPI